MGGTIVVRIATSNLRKGLLRTGDDPVIGHLSKRNSHDAYLKMSSASWVSFRGMYGGCPEPPPPLSQLPF